jgi:hypothetical protein
VHWTVVAEGEANTSAYFHTSVFDWDLGSIAELDLW